MVEIPGGAEGRVETMKLQYDPESYRQLANISAPQIVHEVPFIQRFADEEISTKYTDCGGIPNVSLNDATYPALNFCFGKGLLLFLRCAFFSCPVYLIFLS